MDREQFSSAEKRARPETDPSPETAHAFERQASTRVIKALKIIGSVVLPVVLLVQGADDRDVSIVEDTLVEPKDAIAAPPNKDFDKEASIFSQVKQTASSLFDAYLQSSMPTEKLGQSVLKVLNDLRSSDQEYRQAIDSWQGNEPIFPFLKDRAVQLRFILFVLNQDDLDQALYQTPDYGPDADGDGVIEVTSDKDGRIINELGQEVTGESYNCEDFSRELCLRYGLHRNLASNKVKFRLPLLKVDLREGFKADRTDRGHSFNAVFLGSSWTEVSDFDKWLFIEPQTDDIITAPKTHSADGRLLSLSVPHRRLQPLIDTKGNSLISFFIMPDGSVQPIDDIELRILKELRDWVYMNRFPIRVSGEVRDDLMPDEPQLADFDIEDIYDVIRYAQDANYLSVEQLLLALEDAYLPQEFDLSVVTAEAK